MIPDYLVFAGTEIVNTARLRTYIHNGVAPHGWEFEDCFCDSIGFLLGESYIRPNTGDVAPWVNTAHPESYGFAGVLPLGVEGVQDGVITRTVTNTITRGAIIGPERIGPREMRFTALLVGETCCSVSYGLKWLREALRGKDPIDCETPCGGSTVEMLTCCPDCLPEDDLQVMTPTETTNDPCWDKYARCLHNTALVDGPRIIERMGGSCGNCSDGCSIMKVEWTMVAADPFMYGERTIFITEEDFDLTAGACATWTLQEGDTENVGCMSPGGICDSHPNGCPVVVPGMSPPPPPEADDPFLDYACGMPLDASVGAMRTITRSDHYGSSVPLINIYAGAEDLRNFSIYFFENRLEWDCSRFLDDAGRPEECLACNVISVSYLPAYSVLEINGELGTAIIRTQGNLVSYAAPVLYGKDGSLFTIPSLACKTYCVVAVADKQNTAVDAYWNMTLVNREI